MSPSKLDRYLNILETLVDRPRKTDQIAYKTRMKQPMVKHHLVFLVANDVVEKRSSSNKQVFYAITEKGFAVFKTLRAMKYAQKLRDSLSVIDEASEVASVLLKHNPQGKKR
ncbi:ArsR family transcriptional regulator [Candidatus Bathyarchaeota archaeon]|nr:ArsR family transcriptional regulator [Candidatus Bathyarchaeota archaeon]NIV43344.1 ArsR family transcriptional regulator [Candidatus Bathyarchaeota archaeon]NIW09236.1 ArsR family transcriptional regulator [Gammaproteobacteria bacterium]